MTDFTLKQSVHGQNGCAAPVAAVAWFTKGNQHISFVRVIIITIIINGICGPILDDVKVPTKSND